MKKIIFIFTLLTFMSEISAKAQSQDFSVWNGEKASTKLWGSGSRLNPYLIRSAEDLLCFANMVNQSPNDSAFLNEFVKLTTNIDLNNQPWTPIGTVNKAFRGTFDGDNHIIKNLHCTTTNQFAGFFGYLAIDSRHLPFFKGEVKNLHIESAEISSTTRAGGIVGYCTGYVTNCSFSGTVTSSSDCAGGIVGALGFHGKAESCVNNGTVIGTGSNMGIGGIAGRINTDGNPECSNNTIVRYCLNAGSIESTGNHSSLGGIVGAVKSMNNLQGNITIERCLNVGVLSNGENRGGIIGKKDYTILEAIYNFSDIQMCTAKAINNVDIVGCAESKPTDELVHHNLMLEFCRGWRMSLLAQVYPTPSAMLHLNAAETAITPINLYHNYKKTEVISAIESDFTYEIITGTDIRQYGNLVTIKFGKIKLVGVSGDGTLTISKGGVTRKICFTILFDRIFNGGKSNSAWESPENWSNNTLPNEYDKVIIKNDAVLNSYVTVKSISIDSNQSLVITSGANLIVTDEATNKNGTLLIEEGGQFYSKSKGLKATVQRSISKWQTGNDGWSFITSPIEDQNISAMYGSNAGNNDLFKFDEPTSMWVNFYDKDFDEFPFEDQEFVPGLGYLTAWPVDTLLNFTGTLNTSAVVTQTASSPYEPIKGLNLVGNPFSHDIYLKNSISSNNLSTGYYTINEDGTFESHFYFEPISPCQGFILIADEEEEIIINNVMEGDSPRRDEGHLLIQVESGNHIDKTYISTGEGNNLKKINHMNENAPRLYLSMEETQNAITYENDFTGSKILCFKAGNNGTHTITVKQNGTSFDYLHLIDNLTGRDIDLNQNNTYSFEANKQDYAARFRLVFEPSDNTNIENDNFTYINNGNLVINTTEQNATLQVIDLQGRIISSKTVCGHYEEKVPEKSGLYIIRLIEGDNIKTQKIVISK